MPTGHGLPIAALVSWLLTEALGAFMLRSWIASGSAERAQRRPANPDGMSLPILAGHAGLNLAGLVCWITFVVSGVTAFAFVAIAFMAPAIGLGISTVTIWTPYPTRRARTEDQPGVLPDEMVRRALDDDALSQRLIDELLEHNLGQPAPRMGGWSLRPLIPIAHGALAIVTLMLSTLAASAALR
jgi:hypothetical protein